MKANWKWLNQYVSCLDKTKEELEKTLTLTGTKVETVEKAYDISNVKIGRITKIEKHPNADKLYICTVDLKNEEKNIITSATNVFVNAIVPVALDGAKIANGKIIKETVFRDIVSSGMLCSKDELNLPKDFLDTEYENGIMIIPEKYSDKIGQDIVSAFDLLDYVFDFEITPNRQDCQGVLGIARELSVGLDRKFNANLDYSFNDFNIVDSLDDITVDVKTDKCNRYILFKLSDVKIENTKNTYENISYNLKTLGTNPKNNIVDITNYVLYEIGQPIHAFDLDKIEGNIVVRKAKENEELVLLDDTKVILDKNDIVIADDKKVLALAGIMGGKYSAIDENTKNVVFEIANFERKPLRDTARRLNISSDSLQRFEKKLPYTLTEYAISRIYGLVKKYNIGKCKNDIIDIQKNEIKENDYILLDDKKICKRLGIEISKEFMINILKKLEFGILEKDKEIYVRAPRFRTDVSRIEDIMEEVIRFFGYDKLNATLPDVYIREKADEKMVNGKNDIRNILVDLGYSQIIPYGFISKKELDKLREENSDIVEPIEVINKLSSDYEVMRTTMIPSILNTVAINESRKNYNLKLFEIGKVYLEKENIAKDILPKEDEMLAICYTSNSRNSSKKKEKTGSQMDYIMNAIYVFKSHITKLLKRIGIRKYDIVTENKNNIYHLGQCAKIITEGIEIGIFGMISPKVSKKFDIIEDVYVLELNISKLLDYISKKSKIVETSKFPEVTRDLSIIVSEDVLYDDIVKCVKEMSKKIEDVKLFDIYKSDDIAGKSISVTITFRDKNATLKEEEIEEIMEKIVSNLKENVDASLRK